MRKERDFHEMSLNPEVSQEKYEATCRIFGLEPKRLERITSPGWKVQAEIKGKLWSCWVERDLPDHFVVFTQHPKRVRDLKIAFLVNPSFTQVLGVSIQEDGRGIAVRFPIREADSPPLQKGDRG